MRMRDDVIVLLSSISGPRWCTVWIQN
jgi:hypothetical protein